MLLGDLFDVHAAFVGGDDGDAARLAVDQERQVDLAGDVEPLLDVEAAHLLPLGAGLLGDQLHAQDLAGQVDGLPGAALGDLDAAALAAAAGVDLRLDHDHGNPRLGDEALGDGTDLLDLEGG
jgi:hypothetical protein